MDIGLTLAIFLIIAAILMILFCFLTKYYSDRLKLQRRETQSTCSLQKQYQLSAQHIQGAYEQFREKQQKLKKPLKQVNTEDKDDDDKFIEATKINQIFDISNNIYGLSSLRRRLDSDTIPLVSQIDRSMSLKQFNITKIATQREEKHQFYNYIKKLISYDIQSLKITQIKPTYIKKIRNGYQLVKMVEDFDVDQENSQFLDMLDIHGFCYAEFGYYKYVHCIDTTGMKENESKLIRTLQSKISKQVIQQGQYSHQREIMLLSM